MPPAGGPAPYCAALLESLIEAELFGYADGAFAGARRGGAIGLVKEADGGTLFLDEIGDMPRRAASRCVYRKPYPS
jgi:transcriptional regulator with PAS, ATPase and Fis domain